MAGNSGSESPKTKPPEALSRRGFLKGMGAAAVVADGLLNRVSQAAPADEAAGLPAGVVSGEVEILLNINGKDQRVKVEPRTTLLSALRDRLDITGPKLVCNVGTCGACTVLMDGKPVYGCSVLAVDAVGRDITTVEGLGTPENMNPVQAAFCEKDAMMCGFCTSGFVVSATALLRSNSNPTLEDIKQGCKGNFCRCGTYPHIFQAVESAAKSGKKV
ncbi:MAG TPA: (2Fe-2S)-binding protein [Phycisphaerae bacterium]|nr:(2Fe-2S)-binding protein [Phycisphaerae bacterium]